MQTALASSRSGGGIGGIARTSNCSTVQQGAGQGIGAPAPVAMEAVDLPAFCEPAEAHVTAANEERAPLGDPAPLPTTTLASPAPPAALDEEPAPGHGFRSGSAGPAEPRGLDHFSFERASACSGAWPRGAALTRFRLRPSASAPRHAPGGLRGAEGRRQGVAAPSDGRPTDVGLGARTGRGVRRRRGDRSDPLRLRAHATAPAPRARRSARQATALRARSDRRPRLTSPHLRGPAGQARQATSVRM